MPITSFLPSGFAVPTEKSVRTGNPERFAFIDALRGFAALSVCVYHIDRYGPLRAPAEQWIPGFVKFWAEHGWSGVQMFFVISGFVIAYSIRHARVTPGYLGNFALRRSIRLDPPYWTTIAIVLLMYALSPLWGIVPSPIDPPPQAGQIFAHLFYLQNILGFDNLSVGFWTLCIEVQFYLTLVILTGVAQRMSWTGSNAEQGASGLSLLLIFAPWALASLFFFHTSYSHDNPVLNIFYSDNSLGHFFCMFFLGSLAWWTLEKRVKARWFYLYVAAMLARIVWHPAIDLKIALTAGVAIFVAGKLGRLGAWGSNRMLQFLGKISYSLYLVHFPVSHVIVYLGYSWTGNSSFAAFLWLLLAISVSIVVAWGMYTLVEAPSVRFAARFKRGIRVTNSPVVSIPSGASPV